MDRRLVIIAASITAATMLLGMIAVVPHGAYAWVLYLCVALFGAMVVPVYSIIIAQVSDVVATDELVAASGGMLLLNGIGATIGPVIAGFAMSIAPRGLSYTLVAAQALIAIWGIYTLTRRAAPTAAHKGHFLLEPAVPVGTALAPAHSTAD
jgi:MFS family permease